MSCEEKQISISWGWIIWIC